MCVAQLNHPEVPILPEQIPDDLTEQDELLQLIHQVIFDVRSCFRTLVCALA